MSMWARLCGTQDNKDLYNIRDVTNEGEVAQKASGLQVGQGDQIRFSGQIQQHDLSDKDEDISEGDETEEEEDEHPPTHELPRKVDTSAPEINDEEDEKGSMSLLYIAIYTMTFFLLGGIVSAYLAVGAIYFKPIEANAESLTLENLEKKRSGLFDKMKIAADDSKNATLWTEKANLELADFENDLETVFRKRLGTGTYGASNLTDPIWTIYGSTVFCASVITSIGWGNIVPKTTTGRISCVVYAIFGIPLLFSFTCLLTTVFDQLVAKVWKSISKLMKKMMRKKEKGKNMKQSKSRNKTLNRISSLDSLRPSYWTENDFIEQDRRSNLEIYGKGDGQWTDANESKSKSNSTYHISIQSTIDFMINAVDQPGTESLTRPHYNINRKNVPLLIQYFSVLSHDELQKCMEYAGINAPNEIPTRYPETKSCSRSEYFAPIKTSRSFVDSNKPCCIPDSASFISETSSSNYSYNDEPHFRCLMARSIANENGFKDTIRTLPCNLSATSSQNCDLANKNPLWHNLQSDCMENELKSKSYNQRERRMAPSQIKSSVESTVSLHPYIPTHLGPDNVAGTTGKILGTPDDLFDSICAFDPMGDSMFVKTSNEYYTDYQRHQTNQFESERDTSYLKDKEDDTDFTCNRTSHNLVYTRYRRQYISQNREEATAYNEFQPAESPVIYRNKLYPNRNFLSTSFNGDDFSKRIDQEEIVDYGSERLTGYECLKPNHDRGQFQDNFSQKRLEVHNKRSVSGRGWNEIGRVQINEVIGETTLPSRPDCSMGATSTKLSLKPSLDYPLTQEQRSEAVRITKPYDLSDSTKNRNIPMLFRSDVTKFNAGRLKNKNYSFSQNTDEEERNDLLNLNFNAEENQAVQDIDSASTLSERSHAEDRARNVPFIIYLILVALDIVIGMFLFRHLSTDNTLTDGLYFTVVMLTTIGFGDILPKPDDYLALVFYGFLSLALANFVTNKVILNILDLIDSINTLGEGYDDDDEE